MRDASDAPWTHPILGPARDAEAVAAIPKPAGAAGLAVLRAIADKIGATRRPGALSTIPAGSVFLAQFAAHDLDFRAMDAPCCAPRLDLALIYGDGPRRDAFAYQVPDGPGEPRRLLRLGRVRTSDDAPAWGPPRDLPRAACPHLDARGVETKSDVLVPNGVSDSNLVLGQIQTLWAMLHNALAAETADEPSVAAFARARRIARHVYRDAIINDVLGEWTLPRLRARYQRPTPERLTDAPLETMPAAYIAGVARLGHGLVREIHALNARRPVTGLRSLIRHTGAGRPFDMPLTEDWLLDFGLFFDIGHGKAQRGRAIGPHVARPFALGGGVGLEPPTERDGLVLRDLVACTEGATAPRGAMPSVRTLIGRIDAAAPGLLEGCFAQDENNWSRTVAAWLGDVAAPEDALAALAVDPPLSLFLMLEAEADAGGATLGALGSILLAETLAAALPEPAPAEELDHARATVFRGPAPERTADLVRFLQRRHGFAGGARLYQAHLDPDAPTALPRVTSPETIMFDDQTSTKPEAPVADLVDVADHIELGRLVVDWATRPDSRPKTVAELRDQLDGIASVPDAFSSVEFVECRPGALVIRLPDPAVARDTMERLEALSLRDRYRLPKFYDDLYHKHFGPVMTPLDTFLARVGDQTIAQCR